MLRSCEKRRWEEGAGSRWTSTLLWRRELRKREELWRQGEREVEAEERELREMGEREMSVWDDGREVREEVQLFGCASTAE